MPFIRILVMILLSGGLISAQQVQFCKSVSPEGKPVGPKSSWEIKSGIPVSIYFDNLKPIPGNMVYMFIDRMVAGNFEAYDSKAITVDKNKNWVSFDYPFSESGNYDVYFIDNSGQRLARNKVTIKVTEQPVTDTIARIQPSEKIIFSAQIIFCEKVAANKPVNVKESVSLKKGGEVTVFVTSDEPLNTGMLIVHVYKKKNDIYEDVVQTKKYKIQPNQQRIFFKYKFNSPGEYKFSIHDEFENIIKSANILVTL